jgi:hypothetical protein
VNSSNPCGYRNTGMFAWTPFAGCPFLQCSTAKEIFTFVAG